MLCSLLPKERKSAVDKRLVYTFCPVRSGCIYVRILLLVIQTKEQVVILFVIRCEFWFIILRNILNNNVIL